VNKTVKTLLKELEKTRLKYWNISPETGFFINQIIKDQKYKTVLEIGTSNGYSGIWIAEALSKTKGHLYTIESHKKERALLAQENFKKSKLERTITLIIGHAPEVIPKSPKNFDMAFFDATKYEHLDYFSSIKKRIKKGGIIITDNAISHKKELKPYFENIKNSKEWTTTLLNIGSGLLISIKN
jgi:predicted O-methyltransferase YrrM